VNEALVPAVVAAAGGSATLAAITLSERKRDSAMRASMVPLGLRFPRGLDPSGAQAALDALAGLPYTSELVAEVAAREGSITHALWTPAADVQAVRSSLAGALPGVQFVEVLAPMTDAVTLCLRLFVSTPSVLSEKNPEAASRSLLASLVALRSGEHVALRLALRPGTVRRPRRVEHPTLQQREVERALLRKSRVPSFKVAGLVLIRASRSRARELAGQIETVLRARRGLAGGFRLTAERGSRRLSARPTITRSSGWLSSGELVPLLGWPFDGESMPGVAVGGRELPARADLPRTGRRLFMGRDADGERWVSLDPAASRLHTIVAGSSGSGKSELLARGILDDIAAGHAGAVIDPKADLIQAVLERVPAAHADRVIVLDPGDTKRPTPGVDVLRGGDPDLRTDVLIGALKSIFTDWGIRSETYGRLAIRSLAEMPGATLADTGRLFSSEPFLCEVIARLRDPYLIEAWKQYLALPPGSRIEHIQAPMARVSALLARPRVRAVIASREPKLDIGRLFSQRKWLMVSLAPGTLGEAGASIVGAAITHLVWSAIEARAALPQERRHLISVYLDEMATLTGGVPFSFELLAERARGLGAGLTVAVQTLGRVPEPTRSALLGNAGNFVTFAAPAEDAPRIARQLPGLTEDDVMALSRYHVAARLSAGGFVSVTTGRTLPLPAPAGNAKAIRDASAHRYAPTEPTDAVAAPEDGSNVSDEPSLGRTGRAG
jgi:hypothetical protein